MFNVGDILTSQEVYKNLGVSKKQWERNRKKYLDYLAEFYKIEIIGNGVSRRYKIIEQLQEYEFYVNPRDKKLMMEQYEKIALEEISKPKMNLQLYSTMTNRVLSRCDEKIMSYKHKKGTSYKYVAEGMKEMFGKEAGEYGTEGKYVKRVWARKLEEENAPYDFEEMKGEELKTWKDMLKTLANRKMADTYAQYIAGELDKEFAKDAIFETYGQRYYFASMEFQSLYGYIPQRVKKYAVGATKDSFISTEDEEDEED